MNIGNSTKINLLLQKTPSGVVLASHWLSQQGYILFRLKYFMVYQFKSFKFPKKGIPPNLPFR